MSARSKRPFVWYAAMIHRVSGVALALFLPVHFLVLGLAIENEAALDSFLRWSETPAVKLAEFGLIFLLTAHLLGGARLLVLENIGWSERQAHYAFIVLIIAAVTGLAFVYLAA